MDYESESVNTKRYVLVIPLFNSEEKNNSNNNNNSRIDEGTTVSGVWGCKGKKQISSIHKQAEIAVDE